MCSVGNGAETPGYKDSTVVSWDDYKACLVRVRLVVRPDTIVLGLRITTIAPARRPHSQWVYLCWIPHHTVTKSFHSGDRECLKYEK